MQRRRPNAARAVALAVLVAAAACSPASPTLADTELAAPIVPHAPPTDTTGFVPAHPPG